MKRIWAPWRMKFVSIKQAGCVFCQAFSLQDDNKNLLIHRGNHSFVIINHYPYNSGHLLVVANEHKATLEELEQECRGEIMELSVQAMMVLRMVYKPDGFNLGANIGESAGAGIPGHFHMHIVPRWIGDASYMLALAETKVMPEALEETYQRILNSWRENIK